MHSMSSKCMGESEVSLKESEFSPLLEVDSLIEEY
jgi:hypothetical protein